MKINFKLIVSLVLPFAAGAIGSYFTADAVATWYTTLTKPTFSPPNWLFGPVWTLLYILMGIALFLVWKKYSSSEQARESVWLFIIHLVINSLWSIVFFGWQNPENAFFVIIFLWLFIALLIWRFYQINKKAGLLLIPYFLWVSFASVLNYAIWILNS